MSHGLPCSDENFTMVETLIRCSNRLFIYNNIVYGTATGCSGMCMTYDESLIECDGDLGIDSNI